MGKTPARTVSKTDARLLGTWKSDRRRTVQSWIWTPDVTPEQRKRVAEMFGHLTIRYTRRHMIVDFQGRRETLDYEIIGRDSESVAILYGGDGSPSEPKKIQHIHFSGNGYWINLVPPHVEFFKKIKPS